MADVDLPLPPNVKKGRGKAVLGFKNKMKEGEKILVLLYKGHVVGDDQSKISSMIGQIVKECVRFLVDIPNFIDIPEESFKSAYEELMEVFDMPPYDDIYRWLHYTLLQRWKANRYHIKKAHFDPYTTMGERFAHCPDNVDNDQWKLIVSYWECEEFKVISECNKRNRAKLAVPSTTGKITHINKFYKLKQVEGKSPLRMRNWKLNHTKKDGKPVNDVAIEIMQKIDEPLAEGSQESTGRDNVLSQVLGSDTRGCVRGFGGAVTPVSVFGPSSSMGGGQEIRQLKEEVRTLREELEGMKMLITQLIGTMPPPPPPPQQ